MNTFSLTGLDEAIHWSLPTLNDRDQARIKRTAVRSIIEPGRNPRISVRKFKASYSGAFKGRPPIPANTVIKSAIANDECWEEIKPLVEKDGLTVVHLLKAIR
jgi:hypothetical protein